MRSVLAPAHHPEPTSRLRSETRKIGFCVMPLDGEEHEQFVQFYSKISRGWTER